MFCRRRRRDASGSRACGDCGGVRSFAGVEHRIEFVAAISGVEYFNDSKATNVDATLKALDAFPGNLLVILGGKDKGSDYTILRKSLRQHARMVLLIGAAADKLNRNWEASCPSSERARWRAPSSWPRNARAGDTVCWRPPAPVLTSLRVTSTADAFFKQLVRGLADKNEADEPARRA